MYFVVATAIIAFIVSFYVTTKLYKKSRYTNKELALEEAIFYAKLIKKPFVVVRQDVYYIVYPKESKNYSLKNVVYTILPKERE